ncbi:MAG: hypothetical protein NTV48_01540, partial [Candidatus Vogelbacteria bacterium]|nr:hypothetical protein [Candidatus Vogelbacteria bacterium]
MTIDQKLKIKDQKYKVKKGKISGGFTLLEILVVMGIIILIGGLIAGFGGDIFVNNFRQQKIFNNESEAKITLSQLTTELRTMTQSNTGTYPIEASATSSLIFYSDINRDNLKERVRYFRLGQALKKGVVIPTGQPYTYNLTTEKLSTMVSILASSTETIFSYYDRSYDGSSMTSALVDPVDIKNIRLIKIDLAVGSSAGGKEPAPIYFTSQVSPR